MRISDDMRAELQEFRRIRLGLIERDVPGPIADSLAKDAIEEARFARTEREARRICDPAAIVSSIRATTLRGLG